MRPVEDLEAGRRVVAVGIVAVATALAVALSGCASTQDFVRGARTTVAVVADAQAAGMRTFVQFDLLHQQALATHPSAAADLAAYRRTQDAVVRVFDALAAATDAASKALDAVAAGTMRQADFAPYFAAVMGSAIDLQRVLADAGVDLPGLDALLAPFGVAAGPPHAPPGPVPLGGAR